MRIEAWYSNKIIGKKRLGVTITHPMASGFSTVTRDPAFVGPFLLLFFLTFLKNY